MRSFRELFVHQSALVIFTAANEHEKEKGHKCAKSGYRERRKRKKKEESDGNPTRRYDGDNKSSHTVVPARPAAHPRLIAPQTRGLKRYRIRENRVRRKSVHRERPHLFDLLCGKTITVMTPVHRRVYVVVSLSPKAKHFPMSSSSSPTLVIDLMFLIRRVVRESFEDCIASVVVCVMQPFSFLSKSFTSVHRNYYETARYYNNRLNTY